MMQFQKPMKPLKTDIKLNKNFGYLFTFIFAFLAIFYLLYGYATFAIMSSGISSLFLSIAVFAPAKLSSLTALWMKLGLAIHTIVNPIILGIIFFFIFVPVSLLQRLFKRDELNIRTTQSQSNWQTASCSTVNKTNFRNQY